MYLKNLFTAVVTVCLLASCSFLPNNNDINYGGFPIKKVAQTPPMGWNSWDVFGADVTEAEVKAVADYMAEHLKPFGYEYVVVDIAWYAPEATAVHEKYKEPYPKQLIDQYGRFIPAPNKFPSCTETFKPLADYVHSKGLKFGIHVMRGIPRQAVEQNTPIKGTKYKAQDIVMYEKTCSFYDGLLSIDMEKPGAQEYYNSVIELYTEWGVDFIKADDMTSYPPKFDEVKAFRYAIQKVNPNIVLSLSPGSVNSWDRSFLNHYADMYRISGDFWDEWPKLKDMFNKCRLFKGHTGPGGWADCDMIPLGIINVRGEAGFGERTTRFTPDEQYTLMSLWSVFRSPLMLGMDITRLDTFTLSLITNKTVLKINQTSINNNELSNQGGLIIWGAESPDANEKYMAIFNTNDEPTNYSISSDSLLQGWTSGNVTDIWKNEPVTTPELNSLNIAAHGVRYLSIKL